MKKWILLASLSFGCLICLGDEFEDYLNKEIEYLNSLLLWCDNMDFETDIMQVRYVKGRIYEAESILDYYQKNKE